MFDKTKIIQNKDINQINVFLQPYSIALENYDEEYEQNSDQKLRKRKYCFYYPKKIRSRQ